MQRGEHKDIDAGKLAPELLQARFGSAQAQDIAAPGACEQAGQRGLAATRRAEQKQARKARAFQERGQALGEVALSEDECQFGGALAFWHWLGLGQGGS